MNNAVEVNFDGLIGPNTRTAIADFQRSAGMRPDGNPSQDVLKQLKSR